MTSKEAIEQIKKSHLIAMAMLTDGKPDEKTEKAISIIEKDSDILETLMKNSQYGVYYLSCDKNGKLEDGYLEIKIVIPEDTKKQEFNKIKEWLNGK